VGALTRIFSLVAAGTLAATGCTGRTAHPNVILLVLDTVRRDHLSCYGYERDTSPVLGALASEGLLFESALAPAPWTLPSHASMFTGLPPARHLAHHEHPILDESSVTLAERLAEIGYETAGFCNNPWLTDRTGMTQGFQIFVEPWRTQVSKGKFNLNIFVDPDKHGFQDAGAGATLAEIRAWADARDASRPFFLFVNLIEAHSAYDPPPGFRNKFTSVRLSRRDAQAINLNFTSLAHAGRLSRRLLQTARDLYDGEIAYLDAWLDRFLSFLRERDLLDSSLLIVTSDHGEGFGEHRLCETPLVDHQLNLHDEVLAVPLVLRFPEGFGPRGSRGARVATPVSLLDIPPTVLEVVGAGAPSDLPGISLASGEPPPDRPIASEYYRPLVHLDLLREVIPDEARVTCLADRRVASVRRGARKVILSSNGEELLYDLGEDPGEERPIAGGEGGDRLRAEARTLLNAMERSFDEPPPELGLAQKEALRALGYLP
jgi:arylsulfatase A-like enzyme